MDDHRTDRGAFLGQLGSLIEFVHYKGDISVTNNREVNFKTLLGGGRVAQVAPAPGLRTWSVSTTGLDSSQFAAFDALAAGAYGDVHAFVTPLAQVTNVMTKAASLPGLGGKKWGAAGDATPVGPVMLPSGVRSSALRSAGGLVTIGGFSTPVLPGVPVTGSVYLARVSPGSATITVTVFNEAGSALTLRSSQVTVGPDPVRGYVSIPNVPAGAAYVQVRASGANTIAAPAITWTAAPTPWTVGRGCQSAVISDVKEDQQDADPREPWGSFSFTVTEVGANA